MQAIAFCSKCRGMKVGWNGRYLMHRLKCEEWISKSSKLLILTVCLGVLIFAFPTPSAFVFSGDGIQQPIQEAGFPNPVAAVLDPAVHSVEAFLKGYGVDASHRSRVAQAVVKSAKKHNLDPRLIAAIVIVESRANPFAISNRDAIGIMQIHLPTWGRTADKEGLNLFKIEDNVDFGARILRDYVRRSGIWEGVKRYKGWFADRPESESSAVEYMAKVQRIYGFHDSADSVASTSELLQ
jgi:hypothetical protein